jgi:hypothetical protein
MGGFHCEFFAVCFLREFADEEETCKSSVVHKTLKLDVL